MTVYKMLNSGTEEELYKCLLTESWAQATVVCKRNFGKGRLTRLLPSTFVPLSLTKKHLLKMQIQARPPEALIHVGRMCELMNKTCPAMLLQRPARYMANTH